ncbi:MAG: carboxypeptidase-like regulatory domain-containing protein [Bacteroidetes bacterium]|nr:carboxypeptidase-like regulatory domain-containing protein [Bacteroidota bacterium]
MIKSIFALFLIMFSINTYSQITIGGIVKDEKGISLPDANIYFQGTYEGTSSDANGVFKIQTNLKGKQILLVEFLGFEKYSKELLIENKDIQLEIILKEAFNKLQAVSIKI